MAENKKSRNYLFIALAVIAPNYAMNIMRARYMERVYSGALNYPTDNWQSGLDNNSANVEVGRAQKSLMSKSRDLARNNPYAKKASNVITNNVVGYGIVPKFTTNSKRTTKAVEAEWKRLTNSSLCDTENRNSFSALQRLAMLTTVESGECLAIKYLDKDGPNIQLLEPDFIDSGKNGSMNPNWIYGIKVDDRNRRVSYQLFKRHPGELGATTESHEVPANKVIHLYEQTRPGQLRGVPWAHAVVQTLKDFDDFQYATIIRQKISACLVGVITSTGADALMSKSVRDQKRKAETKMTPGSWKYANPGEDVKFSNPPPAQGYSDFVAETIRAVANGYGITYESISGDYSRVNYSSGRMGHLEMRNNLESWRWNMFIPLFCDGYMELFKDWCKIKGLVKDVKEIQHEWVAPAYQSIDPTKDVEADKEAVLAGFKSKSQVIRENGSDPDSVREEIIAEREADKKAGLNFDVYTPETTKETPSEGDENVEVDEE